MVVLILLTCDRSVRGTLAVGVPLVALYLCASLAGQRGRLARLPPGGCRHLRSWSLIGERAVA